MADVFLSYARSDSPAADRIARALGKQGWSVWFDRELPAHRAYADVIATELEAAPAVLVLWSRASAESEWVRSEANRARELHKLVQARVGEVRLPMPFDQIQCADLSNWRGGTAHAGWGQISKSVEALVARPSREPAQPSQPIFHRRKLLAGGAAVLVVGAAGLSAWRFGSRDECLGL